MWALVPAKVKLPQTTAKLLYWTKASWRQIALPRCKYSNCLKIHSSNTCRDTKCNYVTEGMSVNMEGIQFLLDLGPGDSFPTLFPEVQVQWLCFRPPAAGTCWWKQALHQPSTSAAARTCWGLPSAPSKVQNPRNWILHWGKLNRQLGSHEVDLPQHTQCQKCPPRFPDAGHPKVPSDPGGVS